jgi:hypothetical protein
MIRLIEPEKEWPREIEGTTIYLKQMHWGDYWKMLEYSRALQEAIKDGKLPDNLRDDFNALLGKYFVRAEGINCNCVKDFFDRIGFGTSQRIAEALIEISSLREEDRKNSEGS